MPIKSCGFLVVRGEPIGEFLLMRHKDRWDLPKGHIDPGETEMQCALRELREETGIDEDSIEVVDGFRFSTQYQVRSKKNYQLYDKTLIVFLGRLVRDVPIVVSEHPDYQWIRWQPPHRIQAFTIDPLLAAVAQYRERQ
jgi:8-oxo-dGTP pyrophosphatase MutT (NUDIX family)